MANAILIGIETDWSGPASPTLEALEAVCVLIFLGELVLMLFGFGWIYFQDPWHHLDALVVFTSTIDFIVTQVQESKMSGLSVFRLLRSIRVLRVISHSETMSSLLASFMKGMQSLSWVILLLVLFLYIFAVLAKSFFGDSEVDGLQHASSHLI